MASTIAVNPANLRRVRPETEEADLAIVAAAEALRFAVDEARLACPELPRLDPQLCDDLGEHFRRCRVLANVFDLVADRFALTQGEPLPRVFGPTLRGYSAPWLDTNTSRNRAWIAEQMIAAAMLADAKAREVAQRLRRRLSLSEARPFVVSRQEIETQLEVTAGVSAGTRVVWELEELSNGATTLTLRNVVSAGASVGLDFALGRAEQRTELGFSIEGGEGWQKTFRSRAEAEAHIADHYLKALGENMHFPFPGSDLLGPLANGLNASGMRDAAVKEKIIGGRVSASASGDIKVGTGDVKVGPLRSLSLGGSAGAAISEERNSRDKTHTDRFTTLTTLSGELLLGKKWSGAKEALAEVAVTRDSQGQARSMTLRATFDDKPDKIPEIMGERRRQTTSDGTHRYEIERVYDLTDPHNAQLQQELSTTSDLLGRLDEDAKAVEQLWRTDPDTLAPSKVSVIEQAPVTENDHKLSLDIRKFGGVVGMTTSGYTTVDAWQSVDGKLRQVNVGPR